jgi:hypothetical protein
MRRCPGVPRWILIVAALLRVGIAPAAASTPSVCDMTVEQKRGIAELSLAAPFAISRVLGQEDERYQVPRAGPAVTGLRIPRRGSRPASMQSSGRAPDEGFTDLGQSGLFDKLRKIQSSLGHKRLGEPVHERSIVASARASRSSCGRSAGWRWRQFSRALLRELVNEAQVFPDGFVIDGKAMAEVFLAVINSGGQGHRGLGNGYWIGQDRSPHIAGSVCS